MAISDEDEPALGLWDYHAPEHPFHGAGEAEAALGELKALRAREIQLTAIIQGLSRNGAGLRDQAEVIRLDERREMRGAARPRS